MIHEKTLVEQLKNRATQEVAYRQLMHLYKKRLYWHIRKIVLSHDDTDDVLQNTFIKIFNAGEKYVIHKHEGYLQSKVRNGFIIT